MIIALTGDEGVGKDTFTNFLTENHGFLRLSLGDIMKELCKSMYPSYCYDESMKDELLTDVNGNVYDRTLRDFYKHFSDTIRSEDKNAFSDVVASQIEEYQYDYDIVITDYRLMDEYHRLKQYDIPVYELIRSKTYNKTPTSRYDIDQIPKNETFDMDQMSFEKIYEVILNNVG